MDIYVVSDLNSNIVIFLSQTESPPKHFFLEKKALSRAIALLCF
jgi:hypothetical protein